MTVENLHDAIGLLPSDLIAEADKRRCQKRPKVIPMKRYLAMAACLALVLGSSFLVLRMASGGAKETAAEAPAAVMQVPESIRDDSFSVTDEEAAEAEAAPREEFGVSGSGAETFAASELPPAAVEEEPFEPAAIPFADVRYASTRNIGTGATTSDPVIRVIRSRAELEALRQKLGYYTMDNFDACAADYDDGWFENHDLLIVLVKGLSAGGTLTLDSITESDGSWCIKFYSGGPYTVQREDRFVFAALEKGALPEGSSLFAMFEVP